MTERYAIYFCPAWEDPLFARAAAWLGYDVRSGETLPPPGLDGIAEDVWRDATAAPRKYGFHATMKPPFRLADGCRERDLAARLAAFCATRAPVDTGTLALTDLDGFLALTPGAGQDGISALAADCVRDFDDFRAPPGEDELARRRKAGLSPAQEAYLQQWGYPYVMEMFRFHMTLTGRLDDAARARFRDAITAFFGAVLYAPLRIDSLCLFVQPSLDAPFQLRERFLFAG